MTIHLGTELGRLGASVDVGVGNRPTFPFEPFCLGSHWNENHRFQWWAEAGVQWIRIDITWHHVEPTQGNWTWSGVDACMEDAADYGIKVLAILGYSSQWATSFQSGDPGSYNQYIHLEEYEDAFGNFINQVSSRYGNRIAAYEIWNEPDHGGFLRIGEGSWAANHHGEETVTVQRRLAYRRMIDIAMRQPGLHRQRIVTSGMAEGGGSHDSGFRADLASTPAFFSRYDAANYHVYGYPNYNLITGHAASWKDTMESVSRGQVEHWMTEHGITSAVTDENAVRFLIRSYAVALTQPRVTKLFWFRGGYAANIMTFIDGESPAARTAVYYAFQLLTTMCASPRKFEAWSSGSAEGAMVTRGDGSKMLIAWDASSTGTIDDLGLDVLSMVDQYGDPEAGSSTLGPNPVFLVLA